MFKLHTMNVPLRSPRPAPLPSYGCRWSLLILFGVWRWRWDWLRGAQCTHYNFLKTLRYRSLAAPHNVTQFMHSWCGYELYTSIFCTILLPFVFEFSNRSARRSRVYLSNLLAAWSRRMFKKKSSFSTCAPTHADWHTDKMKINERTAYAPASYYSFRWPFSKYPLFLQ